MLQGGLFRKGPVDPVDQNRWVVSGTAVLHPPFFSLFFYHTPGPPPFSSMNSMPACCSASRIVSVFSFLPPRNRSAGFRAVECGRPPLNSWAEEPGFSIDPLRLVETSRRLAIGGAGLLYERANSGHRRGWLHRQSYLQSPCSCRVCSDRPRRPEHRSSLGSQVGPAH
jgi:hypothetical protein